MADAIKFRVLIVDDIAETRENIRKLLQFEADIEVVAVARTGKEAIQLTQETNPDVVLMDINMPDMDGIAATEIIRQKVPFVEVVILSVQGDQNYMRKAMLVGARDFLTKPPMPDELVAAIRRAGKMAREERSKTAQTYIAAPSGASFNTAT
ncbi:MAG TPA: response regulator, partial [Methylococcales bacterium]